MQDCFLDLIFAPVENKSSTAESEDEPTEMPPVDETGNGDSSAKGGNGGDDGKRGRGRGAGG